MSGLDEYELCQCGDGLGDGSICGNCVAAVESTVDRMEDRIALLRRVLAEYMAGNRIVDGYWYAPDENGEPHYKNSEATAEETALINDLRQEVGL